MKKKIKMIVDLKDFAHAVSENKKFVHAEIIIIAIKHFLMMFRYICN